MSFKPDVTNEEEEEVKKPDEEVKKASPHIPHVQSEQTKEGDSESIEMVPLPATNQGRIYVPALRASYHLVCSFARCKYRIAETYGRKNFCKSLKCFVIILHLRLIGKSCPYTMAVPDEMVEAVEGWPGVLWKRSLW